MLWHSKFTSSVRAKQSNNLNTALYMLPLLSKLDWQLQERVLKTVNITEAQSVESSGSIIPSICLSRKNQTLQNTCFLQSPKHLFSNVGVHVKLTEMCRFLHFPWNPKFGTAVTSHELFQCLVKHGDKITQWHNLRWESANSEMQER